MTQIAIGPGLAERIVALDAEGYDRADIAIWLQQQGLPAEHASTLVAEILEAEAMGEMARRGAKPPLPPVAKASRGVLRFAAAALLVLAASSLTAWLAGFLPDIFGWVKLYGIGLLFGRLLATVAGLVFALIGIAMGADGRDYPLMAGALAGAALFYGFVLQWGGF
ncbi:hypothetical protein B7H23_11705 [Notoacmeibacter marinus]|uniref:Uncharacterized protein n=1 Tax=Notoacmeibacter marinus TaxID=1876515 RepID=A0A231UXQ6_9HYPH|nr:hypothetical protein [Notoacmeibacter marinus]OXT00739.1 hypothetical protein B7H23_11705 [Notoacmeibacter marinus]